jgi:hypothetical protein
MFQDTIALRLCTSQGPLAWRRNGPSNIESSCNVHIRWRRHSWEQRNWNMHLGNTGWRCCSGEQRADSSLEALALARQPRVALENLTTGCSYKRDVIMSFQLHNLGCDCQLLTRGDKNISLVQFEDHRDCETCKIVSPAPNQGELPVTPS